MKSKNTVEINGKLYDAKTGKSLDEVKPKAASAAQLAQNRAVTTAKPVKRTMSSPKYIDGFRRNPAAAATKPKVAQKSTPQTAVAAKPMAAAKSATRQTPRKASRTAKRSTTLNRKVVKAPQIIVSKPIEAEQENQAVTSTALRYGDQARLKRAQKVSQSSAISRFEHRQAADKASKPNEAPTSKAVSKNHTTPVADRHAATKERLVKKAIESATTQPNHTRKNKTKHKKPVFARFAAPALAALILAGYVAYLNIPSISMRVAAHRAGFAASMPAYKPSGYSLHGPIAYSPGQVTINFASNTDERAFSLTQKPTTWDSTALFENLVTRESKDYITYQDRGLTIYLFSEGKAAWVNSGKLYEIESRDAELNTQQILSIATSV